MSTLEYILTEDNTMLGVAGLVTDYQGYKNCPYQLRCLFDKISPDHKFIYEVSQVTEGSKKVEYKFEMDHELVHYLMHSGVDYDPTHVLNWLERVGAMLNVERSKTYYQFKRV